ncbi:MAG: DNA methyltransferase, partial [bacterium]
MSIDSIKHPHEKRAHIPSKEEAGFESANPKVQEKDRADFPLNPVVHRGQDPELFWLDKYGHDDREDLLTVDIRSLYRHEHISPEVLMNRLYRLKADRAAQQSLFDLNELFGNALQMDEIDKVSEYYKHQDGWSNRMIQGDSLLVMASLLEREGMAGKVQMIYIDPPYGIKYGSNWQMQLNSREVKDGKDEHLTGEPEQVKAYRDTWELGIHSYLSYLRDRLLVAKELLTESGSCFVQISDENVHLVRCVMDEVFGSENFVSLISYTTSGGFESSILSRAGDYLIWYCIDKSQIKYHELYHEKPNPIGNEKSKYDQIELIDGTRRALTKEEKNGACELPVNSKVFRLDNIISQGASENTQKEFFYQG